jgi:hypothetical protein
MVAKTLVPTKLLIGPTEVNPAVRDFTTYNFDAYSPGNDDYWDADFNAKIDGDGTSLAQTSHTSYSHMALCGQRKKLWWRNTQNSGKPILSTRGTKEGFAGINTDDYKLSPTLQLHGGEKEWDGNIVFADNRTDVTNNFFPAGVAYEPNNLLGLRKDDIFRAEFNDFDDIGGGATTGHPSGDAFQVLCLVAEQWQVTPLWDKLIN